MTPNESSCVTRYESASRGLLLLPLLALLGCGGLMELGAVAELTELHQRNECGQLVAKADTNLAFLEDRPDLLAQAHYLKADCLMRMRREAEALGLFRYVTEQHPESPYAYQAQARIDAYEGRDGR